MNDLRYQMLIVWSEEDNCYLVHLPNFPEQTYRTHGNSYEEAAKNGQEVLELLLEEDDLLMV
ncbi:type II toxin-antitoxin system HicB family antitoxin [Euhalothece natronophila Z-M001]|uniref:Type II toxin-antitoxin system HicB family antitoxin n=1 Tax=Euhalothece natronophila Z-M001 TaxID=522448 RepID=A0A5B8NK38_9CHRO|nr:type II toxin-antitoxin system HicB family antitoxin [Euhalothece natronophila]QDZ39308.1 type II toxin-antitoxin system HicB family antitoxin [Euhalothece natronophila Z-M001]